MKQTVAIIGAGRVGSSVGFLLARAGYAVTAVVAQTAVSAERALAFIGSGVSAADVVKASGADIVFITTPDRSIQEVCSRIARGGGLKPGALVVHMSGAHSLDLLDAAREAGAYRAVVHPLQSVPSMEQGVRNLPGSYFRVEADPEALATAKELVKALGGVELMMPKWTPGRHSAALYHAGAVAVSNYFVALIDYGLKFYEALGADRQEALKAILPLVKGTLANIETLGIPAALTGPVVRGDVETVRGHIDAMREQAPELLDLYRALARHTIAVARERGLSDEKAEEMMRLLKIEYCKCKET
jgi:predicted short-subunit dehydrogenase-like oxidoreductase (DUF2520 family)